LNPLLKIPPLSADHLTHPTQLAKKLEVLVGTKFPLTGKTRTDGSNLRKLVASVLEKSELPPAATDYFVASSKGVPKILREFVDTYLITTGDTYNLQVWNRIPSSESIQVDFSEETPLRAKDVRFVLIRVDPSSHIIKAVLILTPDYIEQHFGQFGKPTVKHQLIISPDSRRKIISSESRVLFHNDIAYVGQNWISDLAEYSFRETPHFDTIIPLKQILTLVQAQLIGTRLEDAPTKTRGQLLEERVARMLGYNPSDDELLFGGFPDIPHQALEVKTQDSPTVDLGKFTPQIEETVPACPGFTTLTIRYLIALTDPDTQIIEGAILCPGSVLGRHFSYVSDESFKCQRTIPMSFFDKFEGMSVFNPELT
jgi:hypothetical protein